MKKILLLAVLAIITFGSHAQETDLRKGFVGIAAGGVSLANPVSNAEHGIQAQVNFGFLFSRNFGLTVSGYNTSFDLSNQSDTSVGLLGFHIGPLLSTATRNGKLQFDLKPMVGFSRGSVTVGSKSGTTEEGAFTASAGIAIRWNVGNRISLQAGGDYIYGKINDVDLSSYGFNIGINYRFK